jgi:hypothetical protein
VGKVIFPLGGGSATGGGRPARGLFEAISPLETRGTTRDHHRESGAHSVSRTLQFARQWRCARWTWKPTRCRGVARARRGCVMFDALLHHAAESIRFTAGGCPTGDAAALCDRIVCANESSPAPASTKDNAAQSCTTKPLRTRLGRAPRFHVGYRLCRRRLVMQATSPRRRGNAIRASGKNGQQAPALLRVHFFCECGDAAATAGVSLGNGLLNRRFSDGLDLFKRGNICGRSSISNFSLAREAAH